MSVCDPGFPLDREPGEAIHVYADRLETFLFLIYLNIVVLALGLLLYCGAQLIAKLHHIMFALQWGFVLLVILAPPIAIILIANLIISSYPRRSQDSEYRKKRQSESGPVIADT
jgi:hypothetical protein